MVFPVGTEPSAIRATTLLLGTRSTTSRAVTQPEPAKRTLIDGLPGTARDGADKRATGADVEAGGVEAPPTAETSPSGAAAPPASSAQADAGASAASTTKMSAVRRISPRSVQ